MDLHNKVAVVTGISKGIGKACVLALLEKGCKVAGLGMTPPDYTHKNLLFLRCDVRNFGEVAQAFEQVRMHFGMHIHVLINNAGLGYFGNLEDITVEQWKEMYDTNVSGTFHTCKCAISGMKKNESGHIINIASTSAVEGYSQVSAYGSTKWAVRGLSESLYKECRDHKVKVTCVYPGSVKTDFFRNSPGISPHDYMLMPEDIAANILYMLEAPDNFHHVNLEIRPLQPKGPKRN